MDVRVHFLPFHSKVSVRTEGACLAAAPSSDRPNADRAVWERARVSPYRDMLHSDLTRGGRRNAQNNLFLNKLRFPVVVSLVRLSQHI